jgi:hypothetical protein
MKNCTKCKVLKPFTSFCSNALRKDGLHYYCKDCVSVINKTYKKEWRKKGGFSKEQKSLYLSPKRLMSKKIGNLIRNTLMGNGYKKTTKTFSILGAEYEIVKLHLENQFKNGMTWENHGEWHIDHIIPMSSAKNEDELYKLNHYTNLQPLWAKENLQKGAKLNYISFTSS